MIKKTFYFLAIIGTAVVASCKKEHSGITVSDSNKIAPNGFDYKTAKDVTLNLKLLTSNDVPISGVVVNVYNTSSTAAGTAIFTGVTDKSGILNAVINVKSTSTQLIIDPNYLGLLTNVKVNINNNSITATIGGKSGYSGDVVPDAINNTPNSSSGNSGGLGTLGAGSTDFVYPSPYIATSDAVVNNSTYSSTLGRPKYLETTPDVIDAALLNTVNASLPNAINIGIKHPEYLSSPVPNIVVTAQSDVYVTYLAETANNQNSLAYYTYPTGNPPTAGAVGTTAGGIDKITMVFPNSSGYGSGGGLNPGDKVKLGNFPAGTTIGFVLLENAWTGSGVNLNANKYYTDASLNPETNGANKHAVLIYDSAHQIYIYGFEDRNRQTSANPYQLADNDFNDLVFYATTTPSTALSPVNIPVTDVGGDNDGDGVQNQFDAFPNDPTQAYIYYYPSQTGLAQLIFEDNWPFKGDYDFNDLVVNYRYTLGLNAQGQLVTLQGDYTIAAAGASYKNGFGIQLPFAASAVKSVTGQKTVSNYIQFASNGVEAGQTNAVIIPFDNHDALISNPGGAFFINTLNAKDKVQGSVASVLLTLNAPISLSNVSIASLNPFLISNLRRGYEVHLPGYPMTDKGNAALFNTGDDLSLTGGRKTFTSNANYPWAISFPDTSFQYPLETVAITDAYPHFADWASSNGASFLDWYSNLTTGYRVSSNIYSK